MDERLEKQVTHYASMVLEWLNNDSKQYDVRRSSLVEMFTDTLWALEQVRSQED